MRADLVSTLSRNARATPMPTSHRPSRTLPGCGLRFSQPKRFAPTRKHSTSCRFEKGGCGSASLCFELLDCGSSTPPCRDCPERPACRCECEIRSGSRPSFSAISSIAISSATMPGASPGARIALAFGQVEHRQPSRRHAMFAGVKRARLKRCGLGPAVGQVARPAFVRDGGDLAVLRSADTDALNRRGPMRRVVGHQCTLQAPLSRAASRARAEGGQQHIRAQEQLSAEATADDTAT